MIGPIIICRFQVFESTSAEERLKNINLQDLLHHSSRLRSIGNGIIHTIQRPISFYNDEEF